ncbi:hypothetical protein [Streptomyces liangshanensis]|uniref:hypothetical protein n=1 Tax=Streptomyces liangshanensis TaxID=2717324 RepID=UPI0036DC1489
MRTAERFLVNVPASWTEADLTGEALARTRREALAATDDPRAKAAVNDMFRQGREISRAARKHGALYAAGTATQYEDGLFLAYAMVFAVSTPEGMELTLPLLSRQLGLPTAKHKVPADRVVGAVTLENVGRVARVTGTEETPLTADVKAKLLTMHTIMPVPGTTREYLVVTCASPNLPLKEEAYDLFDAITGTFRFVSADGTVVPL